MKRFTKICLIICGVLLVLGLLFVIVGTTLGFGYQQFRSMVRNGDFAIGNNDISGWMIDSGYQEDYEEGENDWVQNTEVWSADSIDGLDIQFDFGKLIIEPSENDNIELYANYRSIWGKYSRVIKWSMDGDTLEIKDSLDQMIAKLFSHGTKDATLTIRIPEGKTFDELTMDIGAADVELNGRMNAREMQIVLGAGNVQGTPINDTLVEADELDLEIGAGRMSLEGVIAKQMDVDCGTGEVELTDVTVQDTDIDCGVGRITIEVNGNQKEYDYQVDCGIGQVIVGDASYSGLGSSKQIHNNGDKYMDIDCGIGEIEIHMSDDSTHEHHH